MDPRLGETVSFRYRGYELWGQVVYRGEPQARGCPSLGPSWLHPFHQGQCAAVPFFAGVPDGIVVFVPDFGYYAPTRHDVLSNSLAMGAAEIV